MKHKRTIENKIQSQDKKARVGLPYKKRGKNRGIIIFFHRGPASYKSRCDNFFLEPGVEFMPDVELMCDRFVVITLAPRY